MILQMILKGMPHDDYRAGATRPLLSLLFIRSSSCLYLILFIFLSSCVARTHGFSSKSAFALQQKCLSDTIARPVSVLRVTLPDNSERQTPVDLEIERRTGILVLLTVPFAWGSFEPATRYVYAIDPPIPAFVFSLAYYLVAALSLMLASIISDVRNQSIEKQSNTVPVSTEPLWPTAGGVELGLYLFVGNALQVLGLKTVPSDRAAFLLQLTTLFVPLLEALFARKWSAVSARTWLACFVALGGVAVMGLDGGDFAGSPISSPFQDFSSLIDAWNFSTGDLLVVMAAVAYSFHCIRLEGYAQTTSAVKLATSKATTETLCSALSVTALVGYASRDAVISSSGEGLVASFAQESGDEISRFVAYLENGFTEGTLATSTWLPAVLAILWTGWVTVAYTIYAQSFGQSRVRPATANLIYTFQPICTALFAWALLGETLGPVGYLGGALIGSAVLLVAVQPEDG